MSAPSSRIERLLAAGLSVLALGCGTWALLPALRPAPSVPTVSREVLPAAVLSVAGPQALPAGAAPTYATTASVRPLISGQLNLNTATEEQLEALPSIGPALAARLIAARPYRNLADLDAVRGVGPSLMEKLTPLVTF